MESDIMIIREATIEDIDNNLLNLYIDGYNIHYEGRKDVFPNKSREELSTDLHRLVNDGNEVVFVLIDNDKIVGYLAFEIKHFNIMWIDQFIIDNEYRNKGYGKYFINEMFKYARKNNYKRVELNCWVFNNNAISFYEELGFREQRIIYEKDI